MLGFEFGHLRVEMPRGGRFILRGEHPGHGADIAVHRWRALWRTLLGGDMGFAESYIAGDWSSRNLAGLLALVGRNAPALKQTWWRKGPRPLLRLRHAFNRNTKAGSKRNIAAHYDLGNAFFAHWLDAGMTYSSALFTASEQSLEAAQTAKLDRVIDLLDLAHGVEVLEIGCGWGGLAERILDHSSCRVTGITLSERQLAYARQRLRTKTLQSRADLRLEDYRDTAGSFDRIVSIEMLEAVGEAFWPDYFTLLKERLRPGGVAVLQVITIDDRRFETYRRRPDFIQKYIFPGGFLPSPAIIEREVAGTGLELIETEFFGDSYARTLAQWQQRFQSAWPAIAPLGFDARFKRIWEYYLAYCQAGFETGIIDVGLYKIRHPAD